MASPGTQLGRVTRLDGDRVYVEVTALTPGWEYGPARYPAATPPTVGDTVAVAFLGSSHDDLIVLAVLA